MTVKELLGRMDSDEFGEWMAWDKIEPFGDQRADLRAAMGHSMFFNVNKGKGEFLKTAQDFMPFADKSNKQEEGLTGAEGAALASRMFRHKP